MLACCWTEIKVLMSAPVISQPPSLQAKYFVRFKSQVKAKAGCLNEWPPLVTYGILLKSPDSCRVVGKHS